MQKISFHGNKNKHDDGSFLGLTVLILLFFVVAVGLLLRASYAEYRKIHQELESVSFVVSKGDSYETC